ncbi:hypothetical protein Barb7_00689 [Bacteroidales bacterium Barb7]|nr:hypothetical protein Barb7_00689 [Bacteroidales bacterium Barb7]
MKDYKIPSVGAKDTINEPVAAYRIAKPLRQQSDISLDENGVPIGYTLEEFSEKLLNKLSERFGVDFKKL